MNVGILGSFVRLPNTATKALKEGVVRNVLLMRDRNRCGSIAFFGFRRDLDVDVQHETRSVLLLGRRDLQVKPKQHQAIEKYEMLPNCCSLFFPLIHFFLWYRRVACRAEVYLSVTCNLYWYCSSLSKNTFRCNLIFLNFFVVWFPYSI